MPFDARAQPVGYPIQRRPVSPELADVIKRFGRAFSKKHEPNSFQRATLDALVKCRTEILGWHRYRCDTCGKEHVNYNSCGNRHCPKCQIAKQAFWVEDRMEKAYAGKHYHIVFTVPEDLNEICMTDSRWFYDHLFAAVWETLWTFGYSHYGVETGAICTLHTWGQNLSLHPHIHCIVPAVGQKPSGKMVNISKGGKYLYPVPMLSTVFKGKFMEDLKRRLVKEGSLGQFKNSVETAWNKNWVVNCQPSFGKPERVVKYLGQYVNRVGIGNRRILQITDQKVTFQMKDYRDNGTSKTIDLDGVEFLRRFCMHILPKRFVKMRYYGVYSTRFCSDLVKEAGKMIIKPQETTEERLKRICNFDVHRCPHCKKGRLVLIEVMPRIRSPGSVPVVCQ
jgi:hypothetical protein